MNGVEPYSVLIGIGLRGIASRITGSIPRVLTGAEVARLQANLDAGYTIEVRTASVEAWLAMRPGLFRQLGLTP